MAPPKPILGVAQVEIVINHEENLDDEDFFWKESTTL
jgi:hypothetical protein